MFHIRSARRTVDSKIDENRCKQKYELIQVMGILYRYIILPPNALWRYCNGKCIEYIEGHALEVVVEVYINCLKLQYFIDRYLPVSMETIQCGVV